jgi:hypothetical protein
MTTKNYTPHPIIFTHIPKTGGSTLRSIINNQYSNNEVIVSKNMSHEQFVAIWKQITPEKRKKIKIIQGHLFYGFHKYLNSNCKYITIVRNPIDRLISLYYHVLKTPSHRDYKLIKNGNTGIQDYIKTEAPKSEVDNAQTRWILNDKKTPRGKINNSHLEKAKKIIKKRYLHICVLERFEESLFLLGDKLNWKNPLLYEIRLKNPKRPDTDEINGQSLQIMEKFSVIDNKLYKFADNLLDKSLKNSSQTFNKRLSDFKKYQKQFEKQQEKIEYLKSENSRRNNGFLKHLFKILKKRKNQTKH